MQVERQLAHTVSIEGVADGGRDGVDRATLETAASDDRVAAHDLAIGFRQHADRHVLERLTVVTFDEVGCPGDAHAGVGGTQPGDRDPGPLELGHPTAVRPDPRPTRPAQGEHGHIAAHPELDSVGTDESMRAVRRPARPAGPQHELHTELIESLQPGPQQRRRAERRGEHAAARTDERRLAQLGTPRTQCIGPEPFERTSQLGRRRAVPLDEHRQRLAVGDVHAAPTGQQELATHRRLVVVHRHRHAGRGQLFGGDQPGRATSDHRCRSGRAGAGHGVTAGAGIDRASDPARCIDDPS